MDNSRFSRFKFTASTRPPPPPPKDDIYQRPNHSQHSLAIVEPPASPMSPTAQYALRRANSPSPSPFSAAENNYVPPTNSSTPSLLSPSAEGVVTTRQTMASTTSKTKALAFLKFPKRSPRTPPAVAASSSSVIVIGNPTDDDLPPPPQEDPGISMPWNFQHNIHVDEGYVGLPPSWSTSLASAGFTVEEIAAIQARRAAGVRSPPDMRYLYNERPQSPGVTTFSGVPILAHPLPRSTSLHRIAPSANAQSSSTNSTPIEPVSSPFPPRPVLSNINTSTLVGTSSNSSTPVSMRKPPPRRKPPSPLPADLEDEAQRTHKPGQASQSTIDHSESGSSSNHYTMDNTTTSFSGLNDSFAYKYNPADTSNGSITNPPYTQQVYSDDTDDDTPLARVPLRLGSESALSAGSSVKNAMGGPGGNSRFKVMNGDSSEREQPRVPLPVGETSSIENGLDLDGTDMEAEIDERPRRAAPNGKETKAHMWGAKVPNSKSKEGLSEPIAQHSSASASTSALSQMGTHAPSSSSSTWKTNVVSKGSTFVDAVRGGVAALRSSASASSKEGMTSGLKSTKAKLAASFRNKRHATSTEGGDDDEAGDSDEEFASLPREGEENGPPVWQMYTRPRAGTDASIQSTESTDKTQVKRTASIRSRDGGLAKKLDPLRRKPSNKSQLSSQSTPSLLNSLKQSRSVSSLRSIGKGHQKSGSMTSLESIPEASPPPLPTGAAATPGDSILGKKAPALPPRLSLHQYSDSSDLSSWSEALLSGISLSAAGKDIGFGLDLDFSNFNRDADDKALSSAPATATNDGGLTAKPSLFHSQGSSSSSSKSLLAVQNTQSQHTPQPNLSSTPPQRTAATRKAGQPIPNSKPPPQRPIPPIVAAPPPLPLPPHPYANPALLSKTTSSSNASSSTSLNGRSRSNSRSRPAAVETSNLSNAQSGWNDSPASRTGPSEMSKPVRIVPSSFTPPISTVIANINKNKQFPPPVPPEVPSKDASTAPTQGGPTGAADKMLSPPPSAWSAAADGVRSPAGSSVGPDSAQLWNEIEQMMDPTMMSSIPGLHLSVLPPGAQGVLRSAGVPVGSSHAHANQAGASPLPLEPITLPDMSGSVKGPKTVGDLVGLSPTYSAAVTETFSPTLPFTPEEERMEAQRRLLASEGVLGTKQAVMSERGRQGQAEEDEEKEASDDLSDYGDSGDSGVDDSVDTLQVLPPSTGLRSREPSRERDEYGQHLTVSRSRERGTGDEFSGRDPNRDSSRSSTSTLTVTALAATTIVQNVSVARRVGAYVINRGETSASSPTISLSATDGRHPPSPLSSHFGGTNSEESGSGDSVSLSSQEQELELQPTPTTTDGGIASPLLYYLDGALTPSPTPDKMAFGQRSVAPSVQSYTRDHDEEGDYEPPFQGYPDEEEMEAELAAADGTTVVRPTIIIGDVPLANGVVQPTATMSTPGTSTPLSPYQQYRGWLSDVVAPLAEFIDDAVEPREHYLDLNEIAEGESGSVFAAVLNPTTAHNLRLPPLVKARDADEILANRTVLVAIKSVAIVPSGSPKLDDLHRELVLMKGLVHDNILSMDGVYVDLREDSLWIRMELMERSLADIIGLVGDGLQLQERIIARFTSDILLALEYLQHHNIAHRDVRSDNLLLNKHGVLKLADFSNAVQVQPDAPMRSDVVGVPFWQAPEVRKPPYNCLKIDVWSLGATVWEMAQQDPPFADTHQFSDRWPPLRQPELFSPAFHDFLRKCSEPAISRPNPTDLLKTSLVVHKACGRQVIVLLLSQCMAIEQALQERD